jgi:glucans biosynthesis protein
LRCKPMRLEPKQLANAARCHARNRSGNPCRCPAVKGKARCRLHGGGKGSGAPSGSANGNWRHGGHTNEAVRLREAARRMLRVVWEKV